MPRIKRRAHRRKLVWGRGHTVQLQTGHSYFEDESFGREDHGTLDPEKVREAWADLGPELLEQWIAEHPGTRPWAWWHLAAPEPMRRTGTMHFKRGVGPKNPRRFDPASREFIAECDFPRDKRLAYWKHRYPTADAAALERFDDAYVVYETERDYLKGSACSRRAS